MLKNVASLALYGLLAAALPAAADQHLVIVNIGDSLAAGEGNPDVPSGDPAHTGWLSASCHRSVFNGRRVASDRINNMDGVSTTFADFSCSGAMIGDPADFLPGGGLLSAQQTDQTAQPQITPAAQITQVVDFQRNILHGAPIDILVISIGVNDVNFKNIVEACVNPLQGIECTNSDAVQTGRNILNHHLLDTPFAHLAAAIRQKLNVKHVYITPYPNEVSIEPGDFCGSGDNGDLSMVKVSRSDNQFLLANVMVPLNTAVKSAAQAANQAPAVAGDLSHPTWRFVTGPEGTFATHGYCTTTFPLFQRRYVNTAQDSQLVQGDSNGTMHPNKLGHQAYADALINQATSDFNLPLEAPHLLRRVEVNGGDSVPTSSLPLPAFNDPAAAKKIIIEVAQHPGTIHATLNFRVDSFGIAGSVTSVPMIKDNLVGALNLFSAQIPTIPIPGVQTLRYQLVITATRGGQSSTLQTDWFSVSGILVQQ
jgi:hypothetical protein